jgi:hypothetical protein
MLFLFLIVTVQSIKQKQHQATLLQIRTFLQNFLL